MFAPWLRIIVILLWVIACIFIGAVLKALGARQAFWRVCTACYGGVAKLFRVQVTIEGKLSPARPLLLVSNHVSYLDIPILGSLTPLAFTPKAEIARWPIIGTACRLVGCVFIDRRPSRTAENLDSLQSALSSDVPISLFPEGTTGNGITLLPFRSSYFSLWENAATPPTLQPARITYTHLNGQPIPPEEAEKIAWVGDAALLPHALNLLKYKSIHAKLTFLPPLKIPEGADRKQIAALAQAAVAGS